MDKTREIEQLLKKPYSRVLVPDEEGGYTAEIIEFPGCFAEGETREEALENLENAAHSWLEAVLDKGLPIPAPTGGFEHSGRFPLRLPRALHDRAARYAQREGVSLNQFIAAALAERVGAKSTLDRLEERMGKIENLFRAHLTLLLRWTEQQTSNETYEITEEHLSAFKDRASNDRIELAN